MKPYSGHRVRPQFEDLEGRFHPSDLLSGLTADTLLAANVAAAELDSSTAETAAPPTSGSVVTVISSSGPVADFSVQDGFNGNPINQMNNTQSAHLGKSGSVSDIDGGIHDLQNLPPPTGFQGGVQHQSDLEEVVLQWTYNGPGVQYFQIGKDTNDDYAQVAYKLHQVNYRYADGVVMSGQTHSYSVTAKGTGGQSSPTVFTTVDT
jgi:hypothetical protein